MDALQIVLSGSDQKPVVLMIGCSGYIQWLPRENVSRRLAIPQHTSLVACKCETCVCIIYPNIDPKTIMEFLRMQAD
ncbi:hypothetical protein TNCT_107251 [Trichonephila clavata]|uniref:Uncharacterized protein n=1 Tax=Trichonephila clavata TaxID=2740835 RepID=A0A8X6GLR2_TRICU|nr:hypothetical protein TNCT_107251 [Trichonephila clavata]